MKTISKVYTCVTITQTKNPSEPEYNFPCVTVREYKTRKEAENTKNRIVNDQTLNVLFAEVFDGKTSVTLSQIAVNGNLNCNNNPYDNNYISCDVEFYPDEKHRNDEACSNPRVLMEQDVSSDLPMMARVWSDPNDEDYTHRIAFKA